MLLLQTEVDELVDGGVRHQQDDLAFSRLGDAVDAVLRLKIADPQPPRRPVKGALARYPSRTIARAAAQPQTLDRTPQSGGYSTAIE